MIAVARAAGVRIIAAGSDASDAPDAYLAAGADVVLHGEALGALMRARRPARMRDRICPTPSSPPACPMSVIATPAGPAALAWPRRRCRNHRSRPLPAWDLIDIEKYRRVWRRAHGYFSLNMAASRGCSFRCNWCAKPIWGNQYLQRPAARRRRGDAAPEAPLSTRPHLVRRRHLRFPASTGCSEFAAALAEAGGGVPFTIQLRADLVSARMAEALRDAGCREVWIGAESGSQKILDAMNKGTTRRARTSRARRLLARRGHPRRVLPAARLPRRGPRRHPRDAPAGRRGAARRRRRQRRPIHCRAPSSTSWSRSRWATRRHWQESNDLEMMFHGTYHSEFYRAVRNLLHDQVTHPGSAGT